MNPGSETPCLISEDFLKEVLKYDVVCRTCSRTELTKFDKFD